jgi:predicted phage tail protein
MSEPGDDDELPEAARLRKALAVACLALELIASENRRPVATARTTIRLLRHQHPDARKHLSADWDD